MIRATPTGKANRPGGPAPTVWGTGLIALDIVFNVRTPHERQYRAGGTCGNVLTILSYLGWKAYPIARLNGDAASLCVQDDFRNWGLNLNFIKLTPSAGTPIIVQRIQRDHDGATHSFSWQCPDCGSALPRYQAVHVSAALQILPQLEAHPPQVFFMDRASRGALVLAKHAKEKGALIIFEPCAVGDASLFNEALGLCHIVKYSSDRLHSIELEQLENGPCLEIKTLGSAGLNIRVRCDGGLWNEWRHHPAFPVSKIVDSAGAGDWFTGGLLHKLVNADNLDLSRLRPSDLESAIRYGQALSAWCCGFEGPRGGMYATSQQQFQSMISHIITQQKWGGDLMTVSVIPNQADHISTDWHCKHCGEI